MNPIKPRAVLTSVGAAFLTTLAGLYLPTSASADTVSVKPPVNGAPGGRSPGGSRDPGCLGQQSVTALVPTAAIGRTTAQYPTFFLSIPSAGADTAVFVLQDENKKQVYKTQLNLKGQSGISRLSLPADASVGLAVGKRYRWFFSVICNPEAADQGGNPYVQGWIERVPLEPQLAEQLQRVSSYDRVALYQSAGLWFDAVATLAQLRHSEPGSAVLKTAWTRLLNSAGLAQVASEPLLQP